MGRGWLVPAAVEHEFGPPAVQCECQGPPDLLEEDGLARPVVDVGGLEKYFGAYSTPIAGYCTAVFRYSSTNR